MTKGDAVGRGYHGDKDGNHWAALCGQITASLGLPIQCPQTRKIHPGFYERLMCFPIGWTALEPLGMDRFQQWRRLHGEF